MSTTKDMVLMAKICEWEPKAPTPDKKKVITACACPCPDKPKGPFNDPVKPEDSSNNPDNPKGPTNEGSVSWPSDEGSASWSKDWFGCALCMGLAALVRFRKADADRILNERTLLSILGASLSIIVHRGFVTRRGLLKDRDQAKKKWRQNSSCPKSVDHANSNYDSYCYQIANFLNRPVPFAGMSFGIFFAVGYFDAGKLAKNWLAITTMKE